jgi:type II restriction enzyme
LPKLRLRQLRRFEKNRHAADFVCNECAEQFELKSKSGAFGPKVPNGAYETLLQRLRAANNPNLLLLGYHRPSLTVRNLIIVPKQYFHPGCIERRPPLRKGARREGWVGSNILLPEIPASGRIPIIRDGAIRPRAEVLQTWTSTLFLRRQPADDSKGWLLATMRVIEELDIAEFTLGDLYRREACFQRLYPTNHNIRAKLRQQLQRLRDNGYLSFEARGRYRRGGPSDRSALPCASRLDARPSPC